MDSDTKRVGRLNGVVSFFSYQKANKAFAALTIKPVLAGFKLMVISASKFFERNALLFRVQMSQNASYRLYSKVNKSESTVCRVGDEMIVPMAGRKWKKHRDHECLVRE